MSWLMSSMTEGIVSRMVNYESSAHIWRMIDVYFASQIRAKVTQFKTQLQSTKKGSLTINEYLLKIRGFIDLLDLVGHSMTVKDQIDAIFEGLPSEYDCVELAISSRTDKYSVEDVEALLLAYEVKLDKNVKSLDSALANVATANYAQSKRQFFSTPSDRGFPRSRFSSGSHSSYSGSSFSNNHGAPPSGRGGLGNGGRFAGDRGSANWNSGGNWNHANYGVNKVVCQLCNKVGHEVLQCYYRFDPFYNGPGQFSSRVQGNVALLGESSHSSEDPQLTAMLATPETVYDNS